MNRVGVIVSTAVAGLVVMGCTRDDDSLKEKLASIDKRLEGIERAIARGGGGTRGPRGQQPQQQKGPDPAAVYGVPIEGAAWHGAKDAKVTVIEAFEFA
jgi:hypothetical protein